MIATIELQKLAVRLGSTLTHPNQDEHAPTVFNESMYMTFKAFERELEQAEIATTNLKLSSQSQSESSFLFLDPGASMLTRCEDLYRIHFNAVRTRLYESAIYLAPPKPNPVPLLRTELLWSCLRSSLETIELFLAMPTHEIIYTPAVALANLGYSTITLSRLLFLESPDWDLPLARQTIDFNQLSQKLGLKFAECGRQLAQETRGESENVVDVQRQTAEKGGSIFTVNSARMEWMADWYKTRLALEGNESAGPPVSADDMAAGPPAQDVGEGQDLGQVPDGPLISDEVLVASGLDFLDPSIWTDFDNATYWGF